MFLMGLLGFEDPELHLSALWSKIKPISNILHSVFQFCIFATFPTGTYVLTIANCYD